MFFNLSLKNVKRSYKDYFVYFMTLTLAISIFYTFNSLDSQSVMKTMYSSASATMMMFRRLMGVISIFISVILGFLVIYANNFLIKRRKKEFGIYGTLGMSNGKVSQILLIETIIIGVISLVLGIIIGVFASQGLAIVTGKMFNLDLDKYYFVFSSSAFVKTIVCFGVIFICVGVFNQFTLSKLKLIDLIYGSKKNEELKIQSKKKSLLVFLLSAIMLSTAYYIVLKGGLIEITNDYRLILCCGLGVFGTLLFFMAIGGFFINIIQGNDKFYLRNLNMFVTRQISSKINTNFVSMTMISIMLFVTICVLSSGVGINKALMGDLQFKTPYDLEISGIPQTEDKITYLKEKGIDITPYIDSYMDYYRYASKISVADIAKEDGLKYLDKDYIDYAKSDPISIIKLSDYNKLMKLQHNETISLNETEFAVITSEKNYEKAINQGLKEDEKLTINGKKYTAKYNKVLYRNITNTGTMDTTLLILNDSQVKGMNPSYSYTVFNTNDKFSIDKFENINGKLRNLNEKENYKHDYLLYSKEEIEMVSLTSSIFVAYIGVYVGVIFILTSGAILAIQQLSEASDNAYRYALLRKIGTDDKSINKALFTQIGIYFLVPLVVAIMHSTVGIKASNVVISKFGGVSIVSNIVFTSVILVVIYGLYFLATYIGAKNNIKENRR